MGLAIGASSVGLMLGFASAVLLQIGLAWPLRLGVVAALMLALADGLGVFPVRYPQASRLVPSSTVRASNRHGMLRFGFEMGTGARTYSPTMLPHLTAVSVLALSGGLGHAWAAALGFAFGRVLVPVIRIACRDPARFDALAVQKAHVLKRSATVVGCAASLAILMTGVIS